MKAQERSQANNDAPRISVVIPVHNKGPHVTGMMQSVLDQSSPPHEIIVIDDASTDDGIAQIRGLNAPNIRILRRDVPGPGGYAARNAGIEAATGDWVAFLDADDTWKGNHIALLKKTIEESEISVGCVFFGFEFREPSGLVHRDVYSARNSGRAPTQISFSRFQEDWLAIAQCPIWTGACAFKRNILIAAGLFPAGICRRGGDKDLWLRAMALCDAMAVSDVTATYNRDATNMVTKSETMQVSPCSCRSLKKMISGAKKQDAQRLKKIFNQEIFAYVFFSWRKGPVVAVVFEDFFKTVDPLRYFLILGMWLVPGTSVSAIRSLIRKIRFG